MDKKAWKKPQLIILSRGRSEEKVLSTCRGLYEGMPFFNVNGCLNPGGQCTGSPCERQSES